MSKKNRVYWTLDITRMEGGQLMCVSWQDMPSTFPSRRAAIEYYLRKDLDSSHIAIASKWENTKNYTLYPRIRP